MIQQQQSLALSPYIELYNLVIPKDNMLRQINIKARTLRFLAIRPHIAMTEERIITGRHCYNRRKK